MSHKKETSVGQKSLKPVLFRPIAWLWILLLFHLSACSLPEESPKSHVFGKTNLVAQGENLYVRLDLDEQFIREQMANLNQGNPLFLSYRFRLQEKRHWLPDRTIGRLSWHRRIRQHLITHRYHMQDTDSGQEYYADDAEMAQRFLGHSLYVPITPLTRLKTGSNYLLSLSLVVEDEGVTKIFRQLLRWLTFQPPSQHTLTIPYTHP